MSKVNRVIPFGYKYEDGKIALNIDEAIEVKNIYLAYKSGLSFKTIADSLTKRRVCYLENQYSWNKSRVKRVLQNTNYVSNTDFPQIISSTEYDEIQRLIESKSQGKRETPTELVMLRGVLKCKKCGTPLTRYMTHKRDVWKCLHHDCKVSITNLDLETKLNAIYLTIDKENLTDAENDNPQITDNELEWIVDSFRKEISLDSIDEDKAKQLILSYAMAEYARTNDGAKNIAEQEIKTILADNTYQSIIEKITHIAESITVDKKKNVSVVLKTGKVI